MDTATTEPLPAACRTDPPDQEDEKLRPFHFRLHLTG